MRPMRIGGVMHCAVLAWTAVAMCGCGGGGSMSGAVPISVMLAKPLVTVQQGGPPVSVNLLIQSPSETALVNVTGLPAGVGVKYAASDTNPSGLLTFTANAQAVKGTFMPTINVQSAGQTAAASFTLTVVME
jgi:hypothetical protein